MKITNVDYEKCTGCKHCYTVCPLDVFTWDEKKKRPVVSYQEECQMCMICMEECPAKAVKIRVPIAFW